MIFDRTKEDVDFAKKIRIEKFLKGIPLTEEEVSAMERGMLTVSTLNRIEQKQGELKELFAGLGYYNAEILNKTWGVSDFFHKEDADRIIGNTEILKKAFFYYVGTPKIPEKISHFDSVNAIEKILHDLEMMAIEIEGFFRECGVSVCGGD